jgi:hypothetical protein
MRVRRFARLQRSLPDFLKAACITLMDADEGKPFPHVSREGGYPTGLVEGLDD